MKKSIFDRFMAKVELIPFHPCWEWTGFKSVRGYGQMATTGIKKEEVHRISYKLFKGEIPAGMCVCHKCDNPGCVNPDHLFLGTQKDNMRDMRKKGRGNKLPVHVGTANYQSKLSEKKVREIKNALKDEVPGMQRKLSLLYGVDRKAIYNIKHGITWKHVS